MALTAAVATAVAAVSAAAALGLAPTAIALALVPGLVLVAAHPERQPLPARLEVRQLAWAACGAGLLFYLTGQVQSADHLGTIARTAVVAVVPLSFLWPAPIVIRFCLLLCAASVVGAGTSLSAAPWPLATLAAAAAVALVSLDRLSAASVRALAPDARVRRRRMVGDAAALFVVAGLAGLLVAALLPPPAENGSRPASGRRPSRRQAPDAPYLQPSDHLDAGGRGSGKGTQIVFRVTAPAPALWRTQTFDRWDGRTWRRSNQLDVGPSEGTQDGRFVFVPPGVGDDRASDERFVQRVRVEATSVGALPAAARPTLVQLPDGGAEVAGDASLLAVPPLGKGATYVVTSARPPSSGEDLRPHDASSQSVPSDVGRLYLEFPALPSRVPALAVEITSGAPTAYDKIRALEAWLTENTRVVAGSPPLPAGADPLDQFLFLDRRGSAEQAASAMAVMLRSVGIPARLAVGYLPGQRSALGGDFVVRARDAHAWVEAWFPDVGWAAFDPAGRFTVGRARDSLLDRLRRLLSVLFWLLAVAIVAAGAWVSRRLLRRWRQRRARPWATRCYEQLMRAGRGRGRPREPHETPAEYCAVLARDIPDDRLVRVGELLSVAAYSGREPPGESRAWADDVVAAADRRSGRARRNAEADRR